ncbi:MAG: glycosyltransferase, partial [Gammaproteobacteria bacterium]|nr:glycosyltransferase [Gammaproteobacteria bacterium]
MDKNKNKQPRLLVFSTLFPNPGQPNAGVFIRERMFRVGQHIPLIVVAPVAWFPGQSLIRRFKPHFRPEAALQEIQNGVTVYHPRFFSIPGFFKWLDGYFLAISTYSLMKRLKREFNFTIIDSHFAYPDGFAATRIGKWLSVPVTITLRGTEVPHSKSITKRPFLLRALKSADKVFSVSNSLKMHM